MEDILSGLLGAHVLPHVGEMEDRADHEHVQTPLLLVEVMTAQGLEMLVKLKTATTELARVRTYTMQFL